MRVFVTGGAGFIGGEVVRHLAAEHDAVAVLARRRGSASLPNGAELVVGDVATPAGLDAARPALEAADAVVHCAAVRRDWGLSDEELRRVNVDSGPRLLRMARSARRFVFVSSVAVYGHSDGAPTTESSPFAPSKRYGASKVEAEAALRQAAAERHVPLTIVRPGITYGAGDTYGLVANMARLIARRRFLVVGSARNCMNLLDVRDLAEGLRLALTVPAAAGEDFIMTGTKAVPLEELVGVLERELGRQVPSVRIPESVARLGARLMEATWRGAGRPGEPFLTKAKVDLMTRNDVYDTSKARKILGYAPRIPLEDGLHAAVAWLRSVGEL